MCVIISLRYIKTKTLFIHSLNLLPSCYLFSFARTLLRQAQYQTVRALPILVSATKDEIEQGSTASKPIFIFIALDLVLASRRPFVCWFFGADG